MVGSSAPLFFVQAVVTAVGGAIVSRLSDGAVLPTPVASASLAAVWLDTGRVAERRRGAAAGA